MRLRSPPDDQPAPEHAFRYEELRDHALERHVPVARHGLAVLLCQGVAAWMKAWSKVPALPPRSPEHERQTFSPLPDESSAEVVRVLAAMALGHMQEVLA